MSENRLQIGEQAYRLFGFGLQRPAAGRGAWIATTCGENQQLAEQLAALNAADRAAGRLLGDIDDAARALSADRPIGRRIGQYEVRSTIGHGGMATVCLAERVAGDFTQTVAIKFLHVGGDQAKWLERFHDECRIMARLDHPFITRLYDGGVTEEGTPYLIMEYVQGQPIDAWCDGRTLNLTARLGLFLKVCDAVAEAHRNLIVHRDIKPENILVTDQGTPKLLDFGIAKLLETEQLRQTLAAQRAMTPEYASPEQLGDQPVTTASDVYALGVLLYHLLTGRPVYRVEHETPLNYMRAVIEQLPLPPSESLTFPGDGTAIRPEELARMRGCGVQALRRRLAGDLDRIVLKALVKEPRERYPSAAELGQDIHRWLDGRPVEAHSASRVYRFRKFVARNRIASTLVVVLFLALSGGLLAVSIQSAMVQVERDKARTEAIKAQEINRFLQNMLAAADPFEGDRDVTVVEALGAAEARIEHELHGAPAAELETRNTIARTYIGLGAVEQAQAAAERSVARALRLSDDNALAAARHVLAQVHIEAGDPERAETLLEAVVPVFRRDTDDWAALATSLGDLAVARNWLGRREEAERDYREAIALYRAHPDAGLEIPLANAVNNLGIAIGMGGDYARAENLHREASEILRAAGHEGSPDYVQTLSSLAGALEFQQDYTHAEPIFRMVHRLRLEQFGSMHQRTAWAQIALAQNLYYQKRYAEAAENIAAAIDVSARVFSEKHPARIYAHVVRGSILCASGSPVDGERDIRLALEAREASLPAGDWLIMSTRSQLGSCLAGQSRFAEAETLLLESYRYFLAQRGSQDEKTLAAKSSLTRLYGDWNKPDKALAFGR